MIVVSNADHPLVGMQVHFGGGSVTDPLGQEGLTYLTGQLLLRGCGSLNQAQLSEAVEHLGASLGVSVGREHFVIEGEVLSRNLEHYATLLEEVILQPRFPQDQLDLLKRQSYAALEERRDSDEGLAREFFFQIAHLPDRISRPTMGTRESLERIDREDIIECAQRIMTSQNHFLCAVGDTTESFVEARLATPLRGLSSGERLLPRRAQIQEPEGTRVVLIDKPERTQSQIVLGHPAIPAAHDEHLALSVANLVFGGTFTARLSHEIREKRGWSYGAYSQLTSLRHHGVFSFRYYPAFADTVPALELGLRLLSDLVSEGVSGDEVRFAKSFLTNQYAFRVETPWCRLDEVIRAHYLGLPEDHLDTYVDRVNALSVDAINHAIRAHLTPRNLLVVVVCTADMLAGPIRALAAVDSVEVHPYEDDWPQGNILS